MDQTIRTQWDTWFGTLNTELKESLLIYLQEHDVIPKNGHGTMPAEHQQLRIIRPPATTYFERFKKVPEYIDIWGLLPLMDALAWEFPLLLKGPKGNGKSHIPVFWGVKRQNAAIIPVGCTESTGEETTEGTQLIIGREAVWELGPVPLAIDVANETKRAVLIFEEVNSMPAGAQKRLNEILDWRKSITINCLGKTYYLNDDVQLAIFMTMNPSGYSGTYDLNEDLKSRVIELELGYPAQAHEKQIITNVCGLPPGPAHSMINTAPPIHGDTVDDDTLDKLLKFAQETRTQVTGYALSIRDVLDIVKLIQRVGLVAALQLTLHRFEGEDRKVIAQRMAAEWGTQVTSRLHRYWGSTDLADA